MYLDARDALGKGVGFWVVGEGDKGHPARLLRSVRQQEHAFVRRRLRKRLQIRYSCSVLHRRFYAETQNKVYKDVIEHLARHIVRNILDHARQRIVEGLAVPPFPSPVLVHGEASVTQTTLLKYETKAITLRLW